MRRATLAAIALLFGLLAAPLARAQDSPLPDPLVVLDRSFAMWSSGDVDGYLSYTVAALRRARQEEVLEANWGFIFASFADFVRNDQLNSPYALRLTEEGMTYLAPHLAETPEIGAMLQVSRVYALADLGRYEEAVRSGRLAEPLIRAFMGDETADGFLANMEPWAKNLPSDANNAPGELARQTLKDAQKAMDDGLYGEAMSIAARALLPEGSGLDPDEVRRINAAVAAKTGRSLYWLDHKAEGFDVMLRASESVAGEKWFNARTTTLALDPGPERQDMAELFFWLARAGLDTDSPWIVLPALDFAQALDDGTIGAEAMFYLRANFYDLLDEPAKAEEALVAAVETARKGGRRDNLLLAEFYLTIWQAAATEDTAPLQRLIDLTRQMTDEATDTSFYDPLFVQTETANALRGTVFTQEALGFARNAFAGRMAELSASTDTQLGRDGQRAQARQLVESLLYFAHAADSTSPGADCGQDDATGMGCVIFATR